jgi:hypothetical protein
MWKFPLTITLIILCSEVTVSQVKEYKLIDKTPSANINYNSIKAVDSLTPGIKLLDQAFKPVKGRYVVYRFLATYKDPSLKNDQSELHDILVIKTERDNKVVDGYQYTLETAKQQASTDLYKSNCKNIFLTDSLRIDKLQLKRSEAKKQKDVALKEKGIIVLQ